MAGSVNSGGVILNLTLIEKYKKIIEQLFGANRFNQSYNSNNSKLALSKRGVAIVRQQASYMSLHDFLNDLY